MGVSLASQPTAGLCPRLQQALSPQLGHAAPSGTDPQFDRQRLLLSRDCLTLDPLQASHPRPVASRRDIQRQPSSREIRRQHVGGLLLDRPRSHNSTEEKARPAIRHHAHRRDRSQTAGLGCKLSSSCLIIPKPKLNKVHYAAHIAALEDKIVQRATAAVLNAIYEEDFLGFSYGFRPGRGTHDALNALCVAIERKKVNWILDADIRSFFDEISQEWLIRFLEHRIGDRRSSG